MLYRTELRRRVCVCVCGSKGGFIKVKVGWVEVKGIKKVVGNWPEVKKMEIRCKLGILKEDSKSGWGSDRKLKSGIPKVVGILLEVKKDVFCEL